MPRITVGVDIGKGSHQAAGYDPATDRVLGRVTLPVSRAGFEQFRLFLERLALEPADLLVGLEATGHYHLTLVELLAELGYGVVSSNPIRRCSSAAPKAARRRPTASTPARLPDSSR